MVVPKVSDIKNKVHFSASSLAAGILGRESPVLPANETEMRLAARPGKGSFTILISSAASLDEKAEINALAMAAMDAAAGQGFNGLGESHSGLVA